MVNDNLWKYVCFVHDYLIGFSRIYIDTVVSTPLSVSCLDFILRNQALYLRNYNYCTEARSYVLDALRAFSEDTCQSISFDIIEKADINQCLKPDQLVPNPPYSSPELWLVINSFVATTWIEGDPYTFEIPFSRKPYAKWLLLATLLDLISG